MKITFSGLQEFVLRIIYYREDSVATDYPIRLLCWRDALYMSNSNGATKYRCTEYGGRWAV